MKDPQLDHSLVESLRDGDPSFCPGRPTMLTHALAATGLFEDAALEQLLDSYPRADFHVTTMGRSFADGGWRNGAVDDLSGREILSAIRCGHLWLNIKRVDTNAPDYAVLMRQLYQELHDRFGQPIPDWTKATLLISSPTAFVYYHADAVPNILWHVRGHKRVLVYPCDDVRFAPSEEIEKICAGEKDEGLPYDASFEAAAQTIDLGPGQALMWPQNSPHRVENLTDLNVSLSTEHMTAQARRRVNVHRGNRLLRRLGRTPRSTAMNGLPAWGKQLLAVGHRGLHKLRQKPPISFDLTPTFQVDPSSPTGYTDLEPGSRH